jgi:hypothetical protein
LGRILWYVSKGDFSQTFHAFRKHLNDVIEENRYDPTESDDPLMWDIITLYCKPENINEYFFRERWIDDQNSAVRRTIWSTIT